MIRSGKQTGYILMPVIVVITLVAAIALLMNTESALESNTAGSELDAQQARYVAEAGLNHAMWLTQQQGCGAYTDLTDVVLGNDKYSSELTTDLGSTASYSIAVDQDSSISDNNPTGGSPSDTGLKIRFKNGIIERPVYRYDLSAVVAKAPIISATAWFYVNLAHTEGSVNIHHITIDWTETSANWNLLGSAMDPVVLASIPAQPAPGVWVSANLTAQVQAWVNGEPNYGIMLNAALEGINSDYASRESANEPYLEVVVGTSPTSPAILKSTATLQNGVNRAISRNDVVLYQHPPGMRHLQPDAVDGEDAEIWDQAPNNNYGAAAETWVSSATSDTTRSLLRFNMGAIPAAARILRADLSLERQSGSGADQPVSAHRIMNPWSEDAVTWNQREAGTNWDTAGADFDNTAVATTPVGPVNQRYAWDITQLAQGWVDGSYPNYGVALVAAIAGMPGERFYTSDDVDSSRWPSLSITYACECGTACVAPQGSGNLLMVVINPTTLVPSDSSKKSLFESWGYTVSVISESANQASYDAAVAVNDVVFISETVNSNSVGTKLADAPIGVVSQDGDYNPDLGISSSSNWSVDSAIDVTSTDHYITRPFAVGALEIYANGMEQLTVNGSESADLLILAESSGDGSLVVLDTGDALDGGGTAAGRRVMLPLGREGSFVWDQLNNNGRLIVQRALEWGAGNKDEDDTNTIILSTHDNAELGGLVFTPADLVEYDLATDTATLYFNGATLFTDPLEKVRSVQVLSNGRIILSTSDSATLGGLSFTQADLVEYDTGTDIATLFFNGAALFSDPATRVASAQVLANGRIILSTWSDATLGGLTFTSAQLVEYNPATDTASLYFDGTTLLSDPSDKIDAVHVIDNGHIVLSTWAANTLGGLSFGEGDLVEYDPVTDTSTLYFDGAALFADPLEKLVAVHIGPGSGDVGGVGPYNVLFVVGNVGSMTTEEVAHQTLIESWGHTVEIIDDGASQTDFDTAVANNDVVFTTNDITASTLGTKLVNATIGVVTSEDNLSDEFGLASAIAWESGTLVEINDNTHYITSPFPTGVLTILTASESLAYVTGTLSPDLGLLASSASGYGVVTLETGDALFGGGSAAGRRAQLPWGGNGFDPGNLNADGLEILKRALEWGAGAGADTGPIAHWKLDETSGPTAVDSVGGHDGTWINDPAGTPGIDNGALSFDGSNDYVDLTSDSELDDVFVGGATVMAWIQPAGWGENGYGRIFDKSSSPSSTGDGWVIRMNVDNGGIINFGQGFTGGRGWWKIPNASISLDTWQHIAIAYDASSTGNDPVIYLDGSPLLVTEVDTPSGDVRSDAAINLRLGNYAGATTHTFDGIIDDARIYDRMLSAAEIADIYAANSPPAASGYTEIYQPWTASTPDNWETVDLGTFGVPPNAVVEVAVINEAISAQRWGGVRAIGSSVDRRIQLHEAEGGGIDMVTMHVQVNASSQIQHYSDNTGQISFILLGYWTGASYTDALEPFTANNQGVWVEEGVGDDGVGPNQVAEILMLNNNIGAERLAGVRASGATQQRRFMLQEAEGGGVDALSMMVTADASSIIEVYSGNTGDIDFYILGTWGVPPGTYTGTGGSHGQVSAPTSWETIDLGSFGVPADSIVQFVLANENGGAANSMRVRELGSTINNRGLNLHEAESGGSDLGSIHANVDSSSQVQWAAQQGPTNGYFYPVGWWMLSP